MYVDSRSEKHFSVSLFVLMRGAETVSSDVPLRKRAFLSASSPAVVHAALETSNVISGFSNLGLHMQKRGKVLYIAF